MKYFGTLALGIAAWLAAPALWAAAPRSQYTDLKNGTVRDNKTELLWQQAVDATNKYDWASANEYCNRLDLGGFSSGWRLPAMLELESLVDRRVPPGGPMIDSMAFPSTPADVFWTVTPFASSSGYAWYVSFYDGSSYNNFTSYRYLVRCVR